jgi:Beta-propeller repeat
LYLDHDSPDFPTMNPVQAAFGGVADVFVMKLNPTGSALIYSTYLGGSGLDEGGNIAVDAAGNVYVVGATASTNFPTVNAFQPAFGGGPDDAFVAKLNPTGSALVYSTYLGGSGDEFGGGIALDASPNPNAYVTGNTGSPDFPTVNPVQPAVAGIDAFMAKIGDISANTPVGTSVVVQPIDVSTTLTFAQVTQAGVSSLIRRNDGPAPPTGFSLGAPPTYYEITTTALFTGPVSVCITYSPAQFADPTMLHLLHLESNVWVDVTTSNDTGTHVICGQVSSFSPFVITQSSVVRVGIDIKPGSFPNSVNLGSGGTVPVAIFSTPAFDARTVNPLTVTLASAPVKLKGKGTPMASFQDVNGDGLVDLVVHVDTTAFELSETDKLAVLEGQTFAGMMIRGTDSVRVVP